MTETGLATTREGIRNYTELERTIAVMLASIIGAGPAAKQLDYPRRTVNDWMEKHGGVAELREGARQVLGHSLYTTAVWLCNELRNRAKDMTTEEITKVLPTLAVGAVAPLMAAGGQSATLPANVVQILIGDKDHREVIEVARSNPDPNQQQ